MPFVREGHNYDVFHIYCGRFSGMVECAHDICNFAVRDTAKDEVLISGENFDTEIAFLEVASMLLHLQEHQRQLMGRM